ncbi:hypothetical protein IG631_23421 [Alternaria alternata]|nr:hypothetical protein IG631_23421 [Alternaria alternata]
MSDDCTNAIASAMVGPRTGVCMRKAVVLQWLTGSFRTEPIKGPVFSTQPQSEIFNGVHQRLLPIDSSTLCPPWLSKTTASSSQLHG